MEWFKDDLVKALKKRESHILIDMFQEIQDQEIAHEQAILTRLTVTVDGCDRIDIEQLEVERVFHIDAIKNLAIDYRLKFLPAKRFKGEIPAFAISAIKDLEKSHQTELENIYIMAPKRFYELDDCDGDPLLFTRIGDNHYYLIAKWGNDVSVFRKWLLWPMRNIKNSILTIVSIAAVIALILPSELVVRESTSLEWNYRAIFFIQLLFMIGGLALMYTLAFNRNTSEKEWNSKYFNG
jgi:hypothetical protein